jgi:integrase/recombinase XerD
MDDETLVSSWLRNYTRMTKRAYRREIDLFLAFVQKPLSEVAIADLEAYMDSLDGLAAATQARSLNALKSLFDFAYRRNYIPSNPATLLRSSKIQNHLSGRILSVEQVKDMIALEPNERNRLILLLFYTTGLRVSELRLLKWGDMCDHPQGRGQLTVLGKGGKTRAVLILPEVWSQLQAFKHNARPSDPVFVSRKRGHLCASHLRKIVLAAAQRAGIEQAVSCHWLRHCHASHALDQGAPLHLVQVGLGHSSAATTSRYLHARLDDGAGLYLKI